MLKDSATLSYSWADRPEETATLKRKAEDGKL